MHSPLETHLASLQRFGIRPGLERIRALLAAVGNPQNSYPVVLVGGTNGKGSTSEFLARHLCAHGRIGLYTSPHLYRWNERIRILDNARGAALCGAISDAELETLLTDAGPHIESVARAHHQPTEFEIMTFLGLWHFARADVAAAVIEVGLGGTWDATNVTAPVVSVVTHVALDHCDRLGATVEKIAADKVGIARANRAFVTAETKPEVLAVFEENCEKIGARLVHAQSTVDFDRTSPVPAWQQINAHTAAVAARETENALHWPHRESEISPAIAGRAEIVRENPTVILDGANNPDGASRLAEHLQSAFPGRKFTFVVGFSIDKDWRAMLAVWRPIAARWIATQADNPRAEAADTLAQALAQWNETPRETVPIVGEAVARALQDAAPDDIIVIAGSFYVLGEVNRADL